MSYIIDFTNYHTSRRIIKVLDFCEKFVKKQTRHNPTMLHRDVLQKVFGMQTNPLSKYLRGELLICAIDTYIPNICAMKYFVNKKNYYRLKNDFDLAKQGVTKNNINTTILSTLMCHTPPVCGFSQALQKQLISGNFEYKEHENTPRKTHELQYKSSDDRNEILAPYGYIWDYDIEAAAPSLILQYALKKSLTLSEDMYLPYEFPALNQLLTNKQQIRIDIAYAFLLTTDDGKPNTKAVKQILHGLLMGGRMSLSTKTHPNQLAKYLQNNKEKIDLFNESEFIIQLKKDLRKVWDGIEQHVGASYSMTHKDGTKRENPRKIPMSAKKKMATYLLIESRVRNVFLNYLNERGIRLLQLHDGFQCDRRVDLNELNELIKTKTEFDVKFCEKMIKFDGDIIPC